MKGFPRITTVGLLLMCVAALGFATGTQEASGGEDVDLMDFSQPLDEPILWYLRAGTADTEDSATVNEYLNELLSSKGFNAGVEVAFINRPDYDTRMNLINSSGEHYDIALVTEAWVNRYGQNVNNEFLLPLTAYDDPATGETIDLLTEVVPALWQTMSPGTWEAARYFGEIYAIPNQQIYVKPFGVSIRRDIMEVLGLRDQIDAVSDWADLTPIFQTIKDAIDDGSLSGVEDGANLRYVFTTVDIGKAETFGYDIVAGPYGVQVEDQDMEVINYYETEGFRRLMHLRRDWYEMGFTAPDKLEVQEAINAYVAGQAVVDVGRLVKPGGALEQAARMGYSWYEQPIAPAFITTGGPTATMSGVSSIIEDDGRRVRAVMKLLEIANTDPEVYNTIAKGVEGTHWEWVDESQLLIRPIENSGYKPNVDWAIGNQFNAYYVDPNQVGAWPATQELNRSATPSVILGFRFDNAEYQTELASISAIVTEYGEPLFDGLVEDVDAGIAELLAQLESAGAERVREAIRQQLADWK